MKTTEVKFEVKGGFDIANNLVPQTASNGEVIGYKLPDGRIARLVIALEIENPKCVSPIEYVTFDSQMATLGFANLDYEHLTFFPKA